MPSGRFAVTVNLQVSFLAPAKGTALTARARALHVVSVADEVETACAIATVTLRGVDFPAK